MYVFAVTNFTRISIIQLFYILFQLEDVTDAKTAFLALGSIPWREPPDGWNVSVVGERLLPAPARIWVNPSNIHILLI